MTERPDRVMISCERCKLESSLAAIHRSQGLCPHCQNATWHIRATYLARQDTADGTTLALNAMGLSLLTSAGVSLGGPLPVEKKPVNGVDLHDIPAATLSDIADPAVSPTIKLAAFIELKKNEQFKQHRQQMEERGQECVQCGMLYVLNDQKPWTLIGTCSKVCCAAKLGTSDYAMVESRVLELAQQAMPQYRERQREQLSIAVKCPGCQHDFHLAKMYGGVYRKCPACGAKVLVPAS